MQEPNRISLGLSNSDDVITLLNLLLADEFVLAVKTQNFHWNIVGLHFHSLHELFGEQYASITEDIDSLAERIRSLGGIPKASMKEFIGISRLVEHAGTLVSAEDSLASLLADHEAMIRQLRLDLESCLTLGDAGTSDHLTGLMQTHEKMAWKLRAHLSSCN